MSDPEIDRIMAMSDDEILAEAHAQGLDLDQIAADGRAALERAIKQVDTAEKCDCGFAAEHCGTNPCQRKKVHLAGLTPGSKWPWTGARPLSRDNLTTK
jgi:hypothetical protein